MSEGEEKSYKEEREELQKKQQRRLIIRRELIDIVKKNLKEMEEELEKDCEEFKKS